MTNEQKALARKILDQVEREPESLYMGTWVSEGNDSRYNWATDNFVDGCGTTRCIAGWAVHFASRDRGETGSYATRHRIANEFGLDTATYQSVGAHLLGLDADEASHLFLDVGEAEAVEMLRSMIDES